MTKTTTRRSLIEEEYSPLYLDELKAAFKQAGNTSILAGNIRKWSDQVFSFHLQQPFWKTFAANLLQEVHRFTSERESIPILLPSPLLNDSPNASCILNEIPGYEEVISALVRSLQPHFALMFPDCFYANFLIDDTDFFAFVVDYCHVKQAEENHTPEGDQGAEGMGLHVDESHATISIPIGHEAFTGGDILFQQEGAKNEPIRIQQEPGKALCFLGDTPHWTEEITSGRRTNLIIYLKQKGEPGKKFYAEYTEYLSHIGIRNCKKVPEIKAPMSFLVPMVPPLKKKNNSKPLLAYNSTAL